MPDFRTLTVTQIGLIVLGFAAIVVVAGVVVSPGSRRASGSVGVATWFFVLFLVVAGVGAVWLLTKVAQYIGFDV